jgi:probable HAF family extracellular repeat protein
MVLGTDGGDRFAGFVGKTYILNHAAVWRNGQLTDLGVTLPSVSYATDVNRSGHVVGFAELEDGGHHAMLWRGATPIRLAELPGASGSSANAINDAGLIIGYSNGSDGELHGVAWLAGAPGKPRDLGVGAETLILEDVSERGIPVGTTRSSPGYIGEAVVLNRNGKLRRLPHAEGANTVANAVGGRYMEYVAGAESVLGLGRTNPVVWEHGAIRRLPGGSGTANAVNRHGLVAGEVWDAGGSSALVWRDGVPSPLLGPDGSNGWRANAVTDDGRVGGESAAGPTVWSCA